jgi:hypothetical protein
MISVVYSWLRSLFLKSLVLLNVRSKRRDYRHLDRFATQLMFVPCSIRYHLTLKVIFFAQFGNILKLQLCIVFTSLLSFLVLLALKSFKSFELLQALQIVSIERFIKLNNVTRFHNFDRETISAKLQHFHVVLLLLPLCVICLRCFFKPTRFDLFTDPLLHILKRGHHNH